MKALPPQIAVPQSSDAITVEVKRLLRAAEVMKDLPTPKGRILACARLIETGDLDLEEYEESLSDKAAGFFHRAMGKVRGFLDRRAELIYVDPQLQDSKKLFVTYHEVIHHVTPWQRFVYTEDDDQTLSGECRALFETEANYGAAEILFQCERFQRELRDYDVSVPSALYLAQKYGASYHSTFRRFVERNHRPCLLLVLKATARENVGGGTSYYISYSIPSPSFVLKFGDPFAQQYINPSHELGKILNKGRDGEIVLSDLKGFCQPCSVESFCNNYHVFVMIYPNDLKRSRRSVLFRSS